MLETHRLCAQNRTATQSGCVREYVRANPVLRLLLAHAVLQRGTLRPATERKCFLEAALFLFLYLPLLSSM